MGNRWNLAQVGSRAGASAFSVCHLLLRRGWDSEMDVTLRAGRRCLTFPRAGSRRATTNALEKHAAADRDARFVDPRRRFQIRPTADSPPRSLPSTVTDLWPRFWQYSRSPAPCRECLRTSPVEGGTRITVSMRLMCAGDRYRYLLKIVVAGDGDRDLSTLLTRYYSETDTPPGVWMGRGVTGLGEGALRVGDRVTERHMQLLIGQGCDAVTGQPLGQRYPVFMSVTERVAQRVNELDPALTDDQRHEQVALIEREEASRPARHPVAGFDFTFSVPKSVSALWAVADAGTQALIAQAHHQAVDEVLTFMERQVAATRTGTSDRDGSIIQADVAGLIATGYDHYDSRAGDPHLHTHVVIANRVQALHDGKWRALDSRPMYAAVVALSEYHQAVLADKMTAMFGVGWDTHIQGTHRNPSWDIAGVPETMVSEFSTRDRAEPAGQRRPHPNRSRRPRRVRHTGRRQPRLQRRHRDHPPQRPAPRGRRYRLGTQRRPLDRHPHSHRRLRHRATGRIPVRRLHRPTRAVCRGAPQSRLRSHGA